MDVRPGYKQTDFGMIPEDWEASPIGEVFNITAGGDVDPKRSRSWRDEIHCHPVYSNALTNYGLYGFCSYADHAAGTITVTARGMVGAANFRDHAYTAIGRVLVLHPKCDVAGKYFSEVINSRVRFANESTGVPQLTAPQISKYQVPVPPMREQHAIAEALSDADALIESLEQLLSKKRQIKQGAMQELLSGKRRLPGFKDAWIAQRLGKSASLKARIGWQGLTTSEYLEFGDYLLVTGTEFRNGRVDWQRCWNVDESRYRQDRYIQLQKGDVLVTKDGTIGKVALVTDLPMAATLNSGVFVIRPIGQSFSSEFFYHLLNSRTFEEFLTQLSAGSTINHLYQKDFVTFRYKLPATIDEQAAIAAVLSGMDTELTALNAKLTKARQLKKGMMQVLLTGQIRLPLGGTQ